MPTQTEEVGGSDDDSLFMGKRGKIFFPLETPGKEKATASVGGTRATTGDGEPNDEPVPVLPVPPALPVPPVYVLPVPVPALLVHEYRYQYYQHQRFQYHRYAYSQYQYQQYQYYQSMITGNSTSTTSTTGTSTTRTTSISSRTSTILL